MAALYHMFPQSQNAPYFQQVILKRPYRRKENIMAKKEFTCIAAYKSIS